MSDSDNRVVNTILTEEENAAFALSLARWSWNKAPVALFISIIISLWRNSWEQVRGEEAPVCDQAGDIDHMGEGIYLAGGMEFVNERFKALVAKCVMSPKTTRRPDQSYDEKGNPVMKRQLPRNVEGQPLIDTKGRLVCAIRSKDRTGNSSPQPKTHPAWILLHTGEGFWVSEAWLKLHGLIYEKSWWGKVYDEETGKDRNRPKTFKEILYHPCFLSQAELDELRAIMLVSTVAEEEGMVKSAALTVRKDGSVELGIGGFGPKTSDARDLYQELHDKDSDDTRTMAKAKIEQQRTNTLPWMIVDYDGVSSRRRDLDMYALGIHPGYCGVKPLASPSREDNKEQVRLAYRLGQDALCVSTAKGTRILREKNTLNLEDGTTFVPKDNPTRVRCVRKLEEYERKNGSKGKYIRYGECIPAENVTEYYSTGLAKRIERSIRTELDGMIRGCIESGQFSFTLHKREGAHGHGVSRKIIESDGLKLPVVVHKCHYSSCPQKGTEHIFNEMGYADVCGASGQEYWQVKAMVVLDLEFFPFLDFADDVDKIVVDVYGPLVGDLMRIAPDAFTKRADGMEVMTHKSLHAMLT